MLICRLRRAGRDETGIAMVMVVVAMLISLALAITTLGFAMQSQAFARRNQDWNSALAAAQAGIADYISQLNRSDDYGRVWDCTRNAALRGPAAVSNTCGWTSATPAGWINVEGVSGAQFHYDVDPSKLDALGTIQVTSTGRSKGVTRTLSTAIGRGGSTDFLYYTTYEHADPANRTAYASTPTNPWCSGVSATGQEVRDIYWWSGRNINGNCQEITFAGIDSLDGRIHVNDTPLVSGTPRFISGLETSDPECKNAVANQPATFSNCTRGSGTPDFGVAPKWSSALYLDDNSAAFATFPGCQYTGPTRIILQGDGTMRVWSKFSTAVPDQCGGPNVATASGASNVPVPDGQVVYVKNGGAARQCATGEVGDGLPLAGDTSTALSDQYCDKGNLYIEGTLKGRVSFAANNSVVVTGDLLLRGGVAGVDMMGLVAGNSVQVFHPWASTTSTTTCKRYTFTKVQPVQAVTRAPRSTQYRNGWIDGYFDDVANPTNWTSGSWTDKRTSTQQWGGGNYSGTWNPGTWSAQVSSARWQPGTWSLVGTQFVWTAGRWAAETSSNTYYQGEQWLKGACAEYNTATTMGEVAGWPRRIDGRTTDIQIYASIQTLQHSFFVQNYSQGSCQGKLTVLGSIAQKWRGIVGQNSCGTGYAKDYRYDKRLKSSSPPFFPQWINAKWDARYTGEVRARYRTAS